jgi:hypothetical protein
MDNCTGCDKKFSPEPKISFDIFCKKCKNHGYKLGPFHNNSGSRGIAVVDANDKFIKLVRLF